MTTLIADVQALLIADTTYLGLLGTPTANPYQTYFKRAPEVPTFPEVVWDWDDILFSKEHDRAILASRGRLSFTAWDVTNNYEDILSRIIWLLHQKPQANGWRAVVDGMSQHVYDPDFNVDGRRIEFEVFYRSGNT